MLTLALHLPDGFLSPVVWAPGWALAVLVLGFASRTARPAPTGGPVALSGVLAAFLFAAQAINFPVAAGTSGHLLGGALAGILLGPWSAAVVMATVVGVQGLLFQDGGLLSMGWNVVNMGVLAVFAGSGTYAILTRILPLSPVSRVTAAFVAGWLSVEVAAGATAVELALSGTSPLALGLPAMVGVHALVGLGEALITAGCVAFLLGRRPDLLENRAEGTLSASLAGSGIGAALVVAACSPLASGSPDGLERVAEDLGFASQAASGAWAPLPDYLLPGLAHPVPATVAAVMLGTVVVLVLGHMAARSMVRTDAPRR